MHQTENASHASLAMVGLAQDLEGCDVWRSGTRMKAHCQSACRDRAGSWHIDLFGLAIPTRNLEQASEAAQAQMDIQSINSAVAPEHLQCVH